MRTAIMQARITGAATIKSASATAGSITPLIASYER